MRNYLKFDKKRGKFKSFKFIAHDYKRKKLSKFVKKKKFDI